MQRKGCLGRTSVGRDGNWDVSSVVRMAVCRVIGKALARTGLRRGDATWETSAYRNECGVTTIEREGSVLALLARRRAFFLNREMSDDLASNFNQIMVSESEDNIRGSPLQDLSEHAAISNTWKS
jgi:hypothetical protein